jgi:CheY-like chemotaxis protein
LATEAIQGRILVVDDYVLNRMQLKRGLEQQGHTVALAENGRQALEMVEAGNFDLMLLDILMPEMDGYEVLARLKGDPRRRDLPVIVISALDEMDNVIRCIAMGAEDFLPKPFDPLLLRARLGACLEKKRLRDQEVEYLEQVQRVTGAAAAVEADTFDPVCLDEVASRTDALGQLARVFQRMAREVAAREQSLRQQVQELRIQIDEVKKAREVAEITETDYFRTLHERAQQLREARRAAPPEPPA